jgi:SAM-dependent MidA family methyltransferase
MPAERSLREALHNLLDYGDLSFRDFVEIALYHPRFGYYSRAENPVGKGADYVTGPTLSPAFSYAIGRLVGEFMSRCEGDPSTIVDIGCGDGGLIEAVSRPDANFYGVDRALSRVEAAASAAGSSRRPRAAASTHFVRTIDEVPSTGCHLLMSNELFDAFPFARLVQRGEDLHELWVTEREGELDWTEREAPPAYEDYFASRGIVLQDGQFADISLDWEAAYADMARHIRKGLIVTMDYGFTEKKLFHPRIRRFGTAASYSRHRVTRDLLANPGGQDLTAHINFSDLQRAGEREGLATLFFDSLAKFLLAIGITEHELFRPSMELETASLELFEARDEARRLVLPDGIGEDLRVLVQVKAMPAEGWSFQRSLFP